ncbi:hypothetical protein CARUB_v10017222mg [Capsella rubella]|uniref:18S pre-ribosomal assembly protein gar2-like protein n=1 Tax=Capsella rubella TaxID=81985 RepID=R0H440_9BRAS|nr:uncharacterized protein LOC17884995 [Capsella rubella]XP_023637749.1 uncharacterized protein LOC17884995 [Capsella rubella]EOA24009.1 hypothetical protein CARUB_v10017222mg [Capsella rubella]
MRADNDHALGNSVESCKDEVKPHQRPEENWKDAEVKILENGKNNNNVCELFYDTRSGDEWDKENDGNILEPHSCGDADEAGKKTRDTSHDFVAKGDSPEKVNPVFYMDKNVTACDLPEIVVCYKENSYHVVKDICVDEGVPVQEKFLFGEKDSVKSTTNSNHCGSVDLMKVDKTDVKPSETKSLEDSNSKVDDSSEVCNDKTVQDVEESSREAFADAEGSSNYDQEHLIVTSPTLALKPSEISLEVESEEISKDEVVISSEDFLSESLTLGDILSREDKQKSLKNDNGNRPEELSPPQHQEKEKRSLETTGLDTKLEKVEEPKTAEENLSSASTTTVQEPNKSCNDLEKPETENHQQNRLVNSYEDDKLSSSRFGETSFSAAESVSISGHITYSGPIAYSGSLSVRSDASTTSGRSFAFPILQSEWNSSPVRMAKADKRRQKGGWRHTLLCCKFS